MAITVLKAWLRLQRDIWRASLRSATLRQRWPGLRVTEPIIWSGEDFDQVEIGDPVFLGPFSEISVVAESTYSKVPGRLRIGNRTWIGASANIRAAGGTISIGNNCLIAHQVSLVASNHRIMAGAIHLELGWDETKTGVTIGDNVWIGCGVTILPGCTVGSNAVIGAGSIVTKNVPTGTIWAGNPARQIRTIS